MLDSFYVFFIILSIGGTFSINRLFKNQVIGDY